MNYQLIVICFILVFLSSCSSKPTTPKAPYHVQNVHQFLPEYASKIASEELQNALVNRGLVLDVFNRTVLVEPAECGVKLYWQYSSVLTEKVLLDLEYFYQGVELNVGYSQGRFFVIDQQAKRVPIESVLNNFKNYNKLGVYRFNISSLTNSKIVTAFTHFIEPMSYSLRTEFVVSHSVYQQLSEHLKSSRRYLVLTRQFNESYMDSVVTNSTHESITSVTYRRKPKTLLFDHNFEGLTIQNHVLDACRLFSTRFMTIEKALPQVLTKLTASQAVEYLPSDANFDDLNRQVRLLKEGKYEKYTGVINVLAQKVKTSINGKNECSNVDRTSPDYAYCVDKVHTSKKAAKKQAIIIGKGNKSAK